jgi:hypothetical protein
MALFEALFPFAIVFLLFVTLIVALNLQGRRLRKHDEWIHLLDVRVDNLHQAKREAYQRSLQTQAPSPPSLSLAKTTDVSDEMLLTLKVRSRKDSDDEP